MKIEQHEMYDSRLQNLRLLKEIDIKKERKKKKYKEYLYNILIYFHLEICVSKDKCNHQRTMIAERLNRNTQMMF